MNIIEEQRLSKQLNKTFAIFDMLPKTKAYSLSFSGGKDSHALLISYLLWEKDTGNSLDIIVQFADTKLESPELYLAINKMRDFLKDKIGFKVKTSQYSYWYHQFVMGYPVPDPINRWCTKRLKLEPMKTDRIALTGRHFGESGARDNRLGCQSGECGIDKMKNSYDPIIHFSNCDVWDLIFYADNTILYEGVFDLLQSIYSQNSNEKGSLRMGCIMCPVVSQKAIGRSGDNFAIELRNQLEVLRQARRIKTPRPIAIKTPKNATDLLIGNPCKILKKDSFNNSQLRYIYSCLLVVLLAFNPIFSFFFLRFYPLGAIYIGDRRQVWQTINKELLISRGYITSGEIELIEQKLKINSYPKTYTEQWIEKEHRLLFKD